MNSNKKHLYLYAMVMCTVMLITTLIPSSKVMAKEILNFNAPLTTEFLYTNEGEKKPSTVVLLPDATNQTSLILHNNLLGKLETREESLQKFNNMIKEAELKKKEEAEAARIAEEKRLSELVMRVDNLNNFLSQNNAGVLIGQGQTIIDACNTYEIDLDLFLAIIIQESGWGRSSPSINQNNISGTMGSNGLWNFANGITTADGSYYQGVEGSILYTARNLRENYYNEGRTTAETIQPKYCPIGASNDPYGTNSKWLANTTSIMYTLNTNQIF